MRFLETHCATTTGDEVFVGGGAVVVVVKSRLSKDCSTSLYN